MRTVEERLADLEAAVTILATLTQGAVEADETEPEVGTGLEVSHQAGLARIREKGKRAAIRRSLGGE